MTIGVLLLRIRLPENQSLKGKRGVVKSLLARLQHRYAVAAAEVGENDRWQIAEIGVSCVSNSTAHAQELLAKVIGFVEGERLDVEVLEHEIEIVHVF
jgi:uncharacterized protein YlxP (DUF503 family)